MLFVPTAATNTSRGLGLPFLLPGSSFIAPASVDWTINNAQMLLFPVWCINQYLLWITSNIVTTWSCFQLHD